MARPSTAAIVWHKVYSGFSSPVEITQAQVGRSRLFVAQQTGRTRIVKNGAVLARPFIDLGGANDQHGTIGNGQDKTTLLGKILRIDVGTGAYVYRGTAVPALIRFEFPFGRN